MSDHVSVRLGLLDKQVVDCERLPIGRVDDLELAVEDGAVVEVEAILTGGAIGGWMAGAAARFRPRTAREGPARIDAALVVELEAFVRLAVAFDELPEVAGLERWLARNVIGRLPGAGDAGE